MVEVVRDYDDILHPQKIEDNSSNDSTSRVIALTNTNSQTLLKTIPPSLRYRCAGGNKHTELLPTNETIRVDTLHALLSCKHSFKPPGKFASNLAHSVQVQQQRRENNEHIAGL